MRCNRDDNDNDDDNEHVIIRLNLTITTMGNKYIYIYMYILLLLYIHADPAWITINLQGGGQLTALILSLGVLGRDVAQIGRSSSRRPQAGTS